MALEEVLHTLIHSMDKTEKRNFKLYNSKYGTAKTSKTFILFDIINNMPEFDDELLKKNIQKKIKTGSINYEKFKLKQLILNSLSDFHFNGNETANFGEIISKIELGLQLKMPVIVEEWLKKGHQLYDSNKETHQKLILQVYERELGILKKVPFPEIVDSNQKAIHTTQELEKDLQLLGFRFKFSDWFHTHWGLQSKESETLRQKLIENPIFNVDENLLNFKQKAHLLNAQQLNYAYLNDNENLLMVGQKTLDLYESHPQVIKSQPNNYITKLFNYIFSLIQSKHQKQAQKKINLLINIPSKYKITSKKTIQSIQERALFLECILNSSNQNFNATYNKKEEVLNIIYKNRKSTETFFHREIFFLFLIEAYFSIQKHDECLDLINQFYQSFSSQQNKREMILAKLFEACIQFDLGNKSVFDSLTNSINYYWRKYNVTEVEMETVIQLISNLQSESKEKDNSYLDSLKEDLQQNNPSFLLTILKWYEDK